MLDLLVTVEGGGRNKNYKLKDISAQNIIFFHHDLPSPARCTRRTLPLDTQLRLSPPLAAGATWLCEVMSFQLSHRVPILLMYCASKRQFNQIHGLLLTSCLHPSLRAL